MQELLEFYRRKVAQFDDEHADMLAALERFKDASDDQVPAQPSLHVALTNHSTSSRGRLRNGRKRSRSCNSR